MLRAYDVAEVYRVEDRARAGLDEGELMARAAHGLARVVSARAEQLDAARLVVLVGPGDNGGDALYAAAELAQEHAIAVVTVAAAPHAEGLAAVQRAGVSVLAATLENVEETSQAEVGSGPHELGKGVEQAGVVEAWPGGDQLGKEVALSAGVEGVLAEADLVVDGLLGIGGRPGLSQTMAAVVAAVPDTAYLISVDLPSGADPAGVVEAQPGQAVLADETVTFGVAKPVHLLPTTRPGVGTLTLVDIGLADALEQLGSVPAVEQLEPVDVLDRWPVPDRGDDKYSRGVVGVVAGSDGYPGAAVLCTSGALGAGAGMVRYLGPRRASDLVLAVCPEVVPGPGRVAAWVLGPGVDPAADDVQVAEIRRLLAGDEPAVVDAGAIELLAQQILVADGRVRAALTLLTPHAGELARLLSALAGTEVEADQVRADPVAHARRAARLTGCTVLLKGASTLVVDPGDAIPVRVQSDAPPWLATAGAGDVLAGVAGVLLAAGMSPREAGSLAALVHGLAAHQANPGGPIRARAVAEALPRTVAGLLG